MILPFLLITLHFSQIGLTEGLTFIEIPPFNITQESALRQILSYDEKLIT